MDNFQYSVQLSDQDWEEFSATADECGLLQAGLASGDELFSSDIDQGDSSGSSPPGPPPLLTGQLASQGKSCQACEEEGSVATWQLASRSLCEPVLALGANKQAAGTSAQPEALLSFSLGTALPDQCSSFLGSVDPSDPMQRFLQGPAPNPSGEPPQSSNSPCHTAIPQKSPNSPDTLLRSPGRKKKRAAGAKGGRYSDTPGPAVASPGFAKLSEARPKESLGLAGARGKGSGAGTAKTMAGAQNKPQPDSAGALSIPVPITEQHTDQTRMTPRDELHRASVPVREAHRAASMAEADEAPPITSTKPKPEVALSTPDSIPQLLLDLPVSVAVPGRALPHSASRTESDVGASTAVPGAEAVAPSQHPILQMKADIIETQITVPSRGHQEKPGGAPGHTLGEPPPGPAQLPKKKKVRFSMTAPSPEDPGSKEAIGSPSSASAWPSTPGMAVGGREGSATWDAVAVGPRTPQPRILKHLPPPAPSASAGTGSGSCFAVTLPEAYEFFFCDTIEEEEEEEEGSNEEEIASQALGDVQWPDICEFFFRDFHTQTLGHQGSCSPSPPPGADPATTVAPGDPVPFSIPEAYEHFLGEDRFRGEVPPIPLLQLQTLETPRNIGTRTPPEPGPAIVEQLSLAAKRAGELRRPLTSFTFSQNDMCLVFVALATWAVRTSDLQTPDAWKTVLLANIGTISAIRYFRRQVRQGRSTSSSPSHDPSSSS
ncbi:PGC-1 and ERR-induced regulator in muscle protein 1 isoform X1 [Fukomys damarensis]|uniref:PGC-1 and ERR-induced regulator in muscle protein 1 n=1 Tax=Fukomys damarensis TaxID=885580 RepID=A0A091DI11_FUKDA|nr:PGC-1 and ERR-induced regulator in muscle protein 1 isoform X1 [Fukomys damarensis]XP_019063510.1 PGC-1 and ERR-induced regulator in muscle protein 1 isoform X1 [Fukomys damarensis]KFO31739.1 hypothetical protein H920_06780 [Fukomys damarensis]